MLLATACVALFIFLDLALTWTNYAAHLAFSGKYARAVNDAQRAAAVGVAIYPSAILESGLLFVYNTLVLAVGILITGIVMLKGIFSKGTAYLGLLSGILGIVSVVSSFFTNALDAAIIVTSDSAHSDAVRHGWSWSVAKKRPSRTSPAGSRRV